MATFPATYFNFTTRYPESGNRVVFENSYTFSAAPDAPDQRIFTLTMKGMQYFVVAGVISSIPEPERNMAVLEQFYLDHKMWKTFGLPHPIYGTIACKFNTPLEIPTIEGLGVLEDFDIELLEQP